MRIPNVPLARLQRLRRMCGARRVINSLMDQALRREALAAAVQGARPQPIAAAWPSLGLVPTSDLARQAAVSLAG
jgi:hypothetical protein